MSTLNQLVARHSDLPPSDVEWLHLLVGDWQMISDLAFADLVLWLPTGDGYVAVAHARPTTGATVHYDDVVGNPAPDGQRPQLDRAMSEVAIQRSREPRWFGTYAVREEAVPVVRMGRAIAVVARQTNLGGTRTPSRLELNYVESADELLAMISRGEFPAPNAATGPRRGAPRVGDGLIRLNSEGEVLYASPNALSCFHRLGHLGSLVGMSLAEVTTELLEDSAGTTDESLPLVVMGRAPWRTDVESRGVCLSLRSVPLTEEGRRTGAVLLCRDVSELRRRERELLSKDATIREIHHRVKNNLQTVAALLRLQARRMTSTEAREALGEAIRRVTTIAQVHETLSQTLDEMVDFDTLVDRSLRLAADVASAGTSVRTIRAGTFGMVPAEAATALALVLTELVTNAVEHGFANGRGGTVEVTAERVGGHLRAIVTDDGEGLPQTGAGPGAGLGTQIVTTLVTYELRGTIAWQRREGRSGTQVVLELELDELKS